MHNTNSPAPVTSVWGSVVRRLRFVRDLGPGKGPDPHTVTIYQFRVTPDKSPTDTCQAPYILMQV